MACFRERFGDWEMVVSTSPGERHAMFGMEMPRQGYIASGVVRFAPRQAGAGEGAEVEYEDFCRTFTDLTTDLGLDLVNSGDGFHFDNEEQWGATQEEAYESWLENIRLRALRLYEAGGSAGGVYAVTAEAGHWLLDYDDAEPVFKTEAEERRQLLWLADNIKQTRLLRELQGASSNDDDVS